MRVYFVLRHEQEIPDRIYATLQAAEAEAKQRNGRSACLMVRVCSGVLVDVVPVTSVTPVACETSGEKIIRRLRLYTDQLREGMAEAIEFLGEAKQDTAGTTPAGTDDTATDADD